jgi:ribonuclease PH
MDGIMKKEQMAEAIKLATEKCKEIAEIQRQAVKDRYNNKGGI